MTADGKSQDAVLKVADKNASIAEKNRRTFAGQGLFVANLIGSPGCGKTSLLEQTAKHFGRRMAVIEGDVKTAFDSARIAAAGVDAVQIETGGACHLNAAQVAEAAAKMNLSKVDILFIENVGNLVCPSSVDLGETVKVAMVSVPEGDEKPAKYPALFVRAAAVVINKIDLLPYTEYSVNRAAGDSRKLNGAVEVIALSCTTGKGLEAWFEYLEKQTASAKRPAT
ncbi:MAG: hydrogenase nickel incorporation protein HypB [Planctomycetes bacterium]|nr:hydrogenase nickel incorporation protein HypB [Planctomycetota bacterium]